MKKFHFPFPWISVWLLGSAAVEACFRRWIAVKILLIAAAVFALLYLLVGLLDRKEKPKEQWQLPFWLEELWNGDWIRTKNAKKKRRLLFLSRLTPFIAFFAFALWRLTADGVTDGLETVLLIAVWVLIGFAMFASELRKDLPTREELAANSPGEAALDKRLRQLEAWLTQGLIDREEYQTLVKKAEEELL